MTPSRNATELPACYAMVHPGLEEIAGDEIAQSLGGEVKRSGSGFVDNTYSTGLEALFQYNGIAIDGSGHVFVTTYGSGTNPNYSNWIGEFSSGGALLTPVGGFHDATSGCEDATGMAIDGSGNVWVSCGSPSTVMQFVGLATPVVTPLVANLMAPDSAAASKP